MTLPKELTTVTPLSRKLALVLFFLLPVLGFLLGMQYQKLISISQQNNTIPLTNQVLPKALPSEPTLTQEITPTLTPIIDQYIKKTQSGFYSYSNPSTSITFQYPKSFYISGSDCSIELVKNNNGSPMNPYIHIAIVDKNPKQSCNWPLYLSQEEEYNMLLKLNIGESVDTGNDKKYASFFTYKRLENQIFQNNKWRLFVSDKVWEGREGEKNYVYFFETPVKNIWISGMVESQNIKSDSIEPDDLMQIVSSFKINNL